MAGEVTLEAADRFAGGLALSAAAGDVVAGRLMTASAGDDHAVQRRVDLAVATLVESLALRGSRAGGDRRDTCGAGQFRRCREALGAGDLANELGRDQRPEPGWLSSCGAMLVTSSVISRSSRRTASVSSRRRRSSSRAIRTRIVCSARAKRREMRVPHLRENSAPPGSTSSGQRSCRCQSSVLLSSTRWRMSRSRWSTSSRRSSSGPASCAAGKASRPSCSAARATLSASDRIGLAALAKRSFGPWRSDASGSAAPAPRARSETAPSRRRRAGSPQAPTPAHHPGRVPTATAHRTRAGRPQRSAPRAAPRSRQRPPRSCAIACECPHRARS